MNAPKRPVIPRPLTRRIARNHLDKLVKEPTYLNLLAASNSNKPMRPRRPNPRHSFFKTPPPKRPVIPRPLTRRIPLNLLAASNSNKPMRPRRPNPHHAFFKTPPPKRPVIPRPLTRRIQQKRQAKVVKENAYLNLLAASNSKKPIRPRRPKKTRHSFFKTQSPNRSQKNNTNRPITQNELKEYLNNQEKEYKPLRKR